MDRSRRVLRGKWLAVGLVLAAGTVPAYGLDKGAEPPAVVAGPAVGGISAPFSVAADGSLSWNLDFELPNGGGGVAPSLGLSYASNGDAGVGGVGVGLTGASSIARSGFRRGMDHNVGPVRFTRLDRLTLDGERLVLDSEQSPEGVGSGEDGAWYRTRADKGLRVFALGASDDPASSFKVFAPDGSVSIYGRDPAAKVRRSDGVPFVWSREATVDARGNLIEYDWAHGKGADGLLETDHRLVSVRWGANLREPKPAHTRRVVFEYRSYLGQFGRPMSDGFVAGQRMLADSMLSKVRVYAPYNGLLRTYRLGYGDASPGAAPKRSGSDRALIRLTSVDECDRFDTCLPATRFTWEETPGHWQETDEPHGFDGIDFYKKPKPEIGTEVDAQVWGDFNGDGRAELAVAPARSVSGPQAWEVWDTATDGKGATTTGIDVAFQGAWEPNPGVTSTLYQREVDRPARAAELDGTPGTELLVGDTAERQGNIYALPPYGLGGDLRTKTFAWSYDDKQHQWVSTMHVVKARSFDQHAFLLEDLDVLQLDGGAWKRRALGWRSSPLGGHRILWHEVADVNADGIDDVVFCASRVDTDAWYQQHGNAPFDAHEQAPFLAGQLRYSLGTPGGPSLKDGGSAAFLDGESASRCGYDDWRYVAPSLAGDGRDQVLLLRARTETGHEITLDNRADAFDALAFNVDTARFQHADSGLPRDADAFMRWRSSGANSREVFEPGSLGEPIGHGLLFPGGGQGRFVDANGDGLKDFVSAELVNENDLFDHLDNGFGAQGSVQEESRLRVYWNTGHGFKEGSLVTGEYATYHHPWDWLLNFASSSAADINGDGREDLVYSHLTADEESLVFDQASMRWIVNPYKMDAEDTDSIEAMLGSSEGLTTNNGYLSVEGSAAGMSWSGGRAGVDHRVTPLDHDGDGGIDLVQFDQSASRFRTAFARPWKDPNPNVVASDNARKGDRIVAEVDGNGRQTEVRWTTDHDAEDADGQSPTAWPQWGLPGTGAVVDELREDSGLEKGGHWVPNVTSFRRSGTRGDLLRRASLGPRTTSRTSIVPGTGGRVEKTTLERFDRHLTDWVGPTGAYTRLGAPAVTVTAVRNLDRPSEPVHVTHQTRTLVEAKTSADGTWRLDATAAATRRYELASLGADDLRCLVEKAEPAQCGVAAAPVADERVVSVLDKLGQPLTETTVKALGGGKFTTSIERRGYQDDTTPQPSAALEGAGTYYHGLATSERLESIADGDVKYQESSTTYNQQLLPAVVVTEPKRVALRSSITTTYDNYGNPTRADTSADGETTTETTSYDASGAFALKHVNALGQTSEKVLAYDQGCGVALKDLDLAGRRTETEIDGFCNVLQTQTFVGATPVGPWTKYTRARLTGPKDHQVQTRVTTEVQGAGIAQRESSDRLGRPILRRSYATGVPLDTRLGYDQVGRQASTSLPTRQGKLPAGVARTTFDALDRPVRKEAPNGAVTTLEYHVNGSVVTTDPAGRMTRQRFDGAGRVVTADSDWKTGIGQRWCYRYAAFDEVRSAGPCDPVHAHKKATSVEVDPYGRALVTTDPQAGQRRTRYDALGHPVEETAADGTKTRLSYDAVGRLVERVEAAGTAEERVAEWSYDDQVPGELDESTSGSGVKESITYDAFKRPRTRTIDYDNGRLLHSTTSYDQYGREELVTSPAPNGYSGFTVRAGYDDHGQLKSLTDEAAGVALWRREAVDDFNNITKQSYPRTGTSTSIETDPLTGRPVAARTSTATLALADGPGSPKSGTPEAVLLSEAWQWHPDGNLERRSATTPGHGTRTESFQYDNRNQLRRVTTTQGQSQQAKTYGYDQYGDLLVSPLGTYHYQPETQRLTDVTGTSRTTTLAYDAAGRTTEKVTTFHGGPGELAQKPTGTLQTKLAYDPLGYVDTLTRADGGQERYSYTADGTLVREELPSGASILHLGAYEQHRLAGGGDLQSTLTISGPEGPVATVHRTYHDGKVSQAIRANHTTSPDGTTTHSTRLGVEVALTQSHFTPWGQATAPLDWSVPSTAAETSAQAPQQPAQGFTGTHARRTLDGAIRMGPRQYDPELGRFLQPDSVISDPNDPADYNRYAYVRNNPTALTDPSGHAPIDPKNQLPGPAPDYKLDTFCAGCTGTELIQYYMRGGRGSRDTADSGLGINGGDKPGIPGGIVAAQAFSFNPMAALRGAVAVTQAMGRARYEAAVANLRSSRGNAPRFWNKSGSSSKFPEARQVAVGAVPTDPRLVGLAMFVTQRPDLVNRARNLIPSLTDLAASGRTLIPNSIDNFLRFTGPRLTLGLNDAKAAVARPWDRLDSALALRGWDTLRHSALDYDIFQKGDDLFFLQTAVRQMFTRFAQQQNGTFHFSLEGMTGLRDVARSGFFGVTVTELKVLVANPHLAARTMIYGHAESW